MFKLAGLLIGMSSCLVLNAQIYLADNGLTVSGSGASKIVSLGGTLNNAATSVDFGNSNSSSNFLFKKGTNNYFFIGNDGKLGIGTASPAAKFEVTNGTNGFRFEPSTSVVNVLGTNGNLTVMPRLNIGFNGDANQALSFFAYAHDNIGLAFDAHHNGSGWISSHSGANFAIYKNGSELIIGYKTGVAAGAGFTGFELTNAVRFSNDGKLGIGGAPGASRLFVNGTVKIDGNVASQVQFTGNNPFNPGFVFNGATSNTHAYTFDSQNFSTGTDGNTRIANGSSIIFYGNGTVQGFQQPAIIKRSWAGVGLTNTLIVDNDNMSAVPSLYRIVSFRLTGTEKAWIDQTGGAWFNGAVGIGTANVTDANYKLFVETGIRTRKVKVDQSAWPDYVFHAGYDLSPLNDVEKYIHQNKHLPDVPSAGDIEKNGLDLGDNQALLLKKIEELTLYIIEQNKKIEQLQKRVDAISSEKK